MTPNKLVTNIMTTKDSGNENSTPSDSTAKVLSIHDEPSRELAISQFAAFETSIEHIRETLVANLGESTIGPMDLERIKISPGGARTFELKDLGGEAIVREVFGVILDSREERMLWKLPMEQSNGGRPPDCFAADARMGIGDPGGDCRICRFAQFGSAPKGEGQACKLVRRLYLLRPGNLLPDILNLPVSSIKPLLQYLRRLSAKGRPCYSLMTNIGLEKARSSQGIEYSRATFTAGELLSPEEAGRAKEYAAMLKSFIEAAATAPVAKAPQVAEGEAI
jgi:hypothetical protein